MGSDVRQRDHLKDLLATTDVWESWTGLAALADRKDRIVFPELPGKDQLPAITLNCGPSRRRVNPPGSERAAVTAHGSILVLVFDAFDETVDIQVEEKRFATELTDLVDELVSHPDIAQFKSPMRISEIELPEDAWRRTEIQTEDDLDESDSDASANNYFSGPVWIGKFIVRWDPFR